MNLSFSIESSSSSSPLRQELNLFSRLIYLNKNQHRQSIWFKRTIQIYRRLNRIFKSSDSQQQQQQQQQLLFDRSFQSDLLTAYDSIVQNLARTAFMSTGMAFVGCLARIHSIINQRSNQSESVKIKSLLKSNK